MLRSYWLDPYSLFFVEVILMQFAEIRRWQDFRKPGSQGEQYFLGLETVLKGSGDPSYPGQSPPGHPQHLETPASALAQAPCAPADDWQPMQRKPWAVRARIAWQAGVSHGGMQPIV